MPTIVMYEETMSPSLENVRVLRESLSKVLHQLPITQGEIANICVAVSEIATNVVEHGAPHVSELGLRIVRSNRDLAIEIVDDGEPYDPDANMAEDIDFATMLESGRGISIVKQMFPNSSYFPAMRDGGKNVYRISTGTGTEVTKKRIAVIDDDLVLLELLAAYLEDDYDICQFSEAKVALAELELNPVDMVISDIQMPDIDGFTLRKRLIENAHIGNIPFIFLTGREDEQMRDTAMDLGIDDYLMKPVEPSNLRSVVKRVLIRAARESSQLASAITEPLKPKMPDTIPGFRCTVRTESAEGGGGDLVFSRSVENGTLIVIADIVGHGPVAKFFAHAHAGYLYGVLAAPGTSVHPGAVLSSLSRAIHDGGLLEQALLTCAALFVDLEGNVTAACAAHPPPMVVRDGKFEIMPIEGMLPGLLGDVMYEEYQTRLEPGERLFVITDGIFESADTPEDRDKLEAGTKKAMAESSAFDLNAAADFVVMRYEELSGISQRDDATLVVLERSPVV